MLAFSQKIYRVKENYESCLLMLNTWNCVYITGCEEPEKKAHSSKTCSFYNNKTGVFEYVECILFCTFSIALWSLFSHKWSSKQIEFRRHHHSFNAGYASYTGYTIKSSWSCTNCKKIGFRVLLIFLLAIFKGQYTCSEVSFRTLGCVKFHNLPALIAENKLLEQLVQVFTTETSIYNIY